MKCPKCQFENPEDSIFCGDCGSPLAIVCPECGSIPLPGLKFCTRCGYDLRTPQTPSESSSRIMVIPGNSLGFALYQKYRWVLALIALLAVFSPILVSVLLSMRR